MDAGIAFLGPIQVRVRRIDQRIGPGERAAEKTEGREVEADAGAAERLVGGFGQKSPFAIAQRIHVLSKEELSVEEGSLYPALQKLLVNGWVKAAWTKSESGRDVREYRLTPGGRKKLESALAEYRRVGRAIDMLLDRAMGRAG